MGIRTDMAAELRTGAMAQNAKKKDHEPDGVIYDECILPSGNKKSTIDIVNENGSGSLGRPCGRYVTISFDDIIDMTYDRFESLCRIVSAELADIADRAAPQRTSLLLCGLGNRRLASDAIGTYAAEAVISTRHIKEYNRALFDGAGFFDVSTLCPGVKAQTGMETAELILGAVKSISPSLVIVVDSLAAGQSENLCRTVQLTDTGIAPGSGIGNHRTAINRELLGVPVVAIGVPTVIDAATLVPDAPDSLYGMFVSPKDIDARALLIGRMIGYSVNLAFHRSISVPDMMIMQ